MMRHMLTISAVLIATAGAAAVAAPPTLTQAANPAVKLVIAGSSAAEPAFASGIATLLCGSTSNLLVMTTQANGPDFNAYSCIPPAGTGGLAFANGTNVVTIFYRGEGGSPVGVLPVVSNTSIKRLNLSDASCNAAGTSGTCVVSGTRSASATSDGWTGAVIADKVQVGISDLEPPKFTGANAPTTYTFLGTVTASQLAAAETSVVFQQAYGIFVNTAAPGPTGLTSLSRPALMNILIGNYVDWNLVPAATGNQPVTATSSPISLCGREPGSGSRAATAMYFTGYSCSTAQTLQTPTQVSYSASDALACANARPGAITYATIDRANSVGPGKTYPNLTLIGMGGVTPSSLATATGNYDFMYEAVATVNRPAYDSNSDALVVFLIDKMRALSSAPVTAQITAVPGWGGNVPAVPTPSHTVGSTTVYEGVFTRAGVSCNDLFEAN